MPEITHTNENLNQLQDAIQTNDIDKVRALLKQTSLLISRSESSSLTEFVNKNTELLGKQFNPVIIFELLAAGFNLPFLAFLMDFEKNNLGLQVLLHLIPQLSSKEQEILNDLKNLDLDTCQISLCIPAIPVRVDRTMVCFNEILGTNKDNKFTMLIGNLVKPLLQQMHLISLDLQYITTARNIIRTQLPYSDNAHDLQISALFLEHYKIIEDSNRLVDTLLDSLKKKLIARRNEDLFFVVFGILLQLLLNSHIAQVEKIPFVNLVLVNLTLIVSNIIHLWHSYQLHILSYDTLNIRNLDIETFGYRFVRNLLLKLKNELNVIEQYKKVKEFDFVKARKELPVIISERFQEQYKESDKYPGLFFWKQAFEERAKLNTTQQSDNDSVNAPVLRLTS